MFGFSKKATLPSKDFVGWANSLAERTPDIAILEQYNKQLLFVGDELMKNKSQHKLIVKHGGKLECRAFTQNTFTFQRHDLTAFTMPIPLLAKPDKRPTWMLPKPGQPAPIKGEVYSLPPQAFIDLDIHKGNGLQFQRRRVHLNVHCRPLVTLPWLMPYDRKHNPRGGISHAERALRNPQENPGPFMGEEKISELRAWMYIGKPEFWKPIFEPEATDDNHFPKQPEPVKLFQQDDGPIYYHFTK